MNYFISLLYFSFSTMGYLQASPTTNYRSGDINSLTHLLSRGTKSYFLVGAKSTFLEAYQFCKDKYLNLVRIESCEELNALENKIRNSTNNNRDFWTSGYKLLNEKWIWTSTGEEIAYTRWGDMVSNNSDELCLQLSILSDSLHYSSRMCKAKLSFICESNYPLSPIDSKPNSCYATNNVDQNKNYYIETNKKATYFEANQICIRLGMQLVSIDSEANNKVLNKYIEDSDAWNSYWSSGYKFIHTTTWAWISNYKLLNYTNWMPNTDTTTDGERCLELVKDYNGLLWRASACGKKLSFICENLENVLPIKFTGFLSHEISSPPKPNNLIDKESDILTPKTVVNKRAYRVSTTRLVHREASIICRDVGMELLSLDDPAENEVVKDLIKKVNNPYNKDQYWEAGTWTSAIKWSNGHWSWEDGRNFSFTNWFPGEPNKLGGKLDICMQLFNNGQWDDVGCNYQRYFICEAPYSSKC